MEKMRQWTMLTAVAVVAVLAAGWFLLVSPQKSRAASLRTQAASQQSANTTLQSRVNQLKEQKKGLPAQQRKLDQIAAKVPDNPQLPVLIRQLSAAAQGAGVDLVSLAPSTPALVAAQTPAVTAPAAATTTGTTQGTGVQPAHATPAAAAVSPLAQIPVTLTVQGSYYNIESFFRSVEKLTRAMLVQQWSLTPATGAVAASSTPATGSTSGGSSASAQALPPGTLTGVLTAFVFESPQVAAAQSAPSSPTAGAAQ
jgi:Tfp pilus assembly protein PilO